MTEATQEKRRCILTVDDDPITLMMLANGMKTAGYNILQAGSAEEAIQLLSGQTPDLALLDIALPGMSGIELAKHLRNQTNIPIMFLSSHREVDIVREAVQNGAVGYLVKPIDISHIMPSIEAGLARAEEIRKLRRIESDLTTALASGSETNDALLRELEDLVAQRTSQLASANILLTEDRLKRKQIEAELLGRYAELTDLNTRLDRAEEHLTEKKLYERELWRMANEDALTALPNRHWLNNILPDALERARLAGNQLALFFIDLDDFKNVNDTLGHAAGDLLLREVADRLRSVLRPSDYVVRLGGDEFTVILDPVDGIEDVAYVASRIIEVLREPFELLRGRNTIGTSIGITIFPRDGEDTETLLKNSDIAMYHANAQGKGHFRFYQPELYENLKVRLDTERALVQALENNQFVLHYEPRICTFTGELRGLEALVRWQHPERGLVQPNQFIPLAEDNGLILKLGEVVLEQACAQLAQWKKDGLKLVPLSINVSARQFNNGNIRNLFATYLERHEIPTDMLEIELTESSMMGDHTDVLEQLSAIKKMGIKLLVDDFGTGYSSLSLLQRLDMDVLKVDRSFTSDLGNSAEGEIFFNAIVSMAHALGMLVVAEGVETEQQLRILQSLSCDEIQGYFIARPVPAEEVPTLLRRRFIVEHLVEGTNSAEAFQLR
ncbi:MAG: putative bifunctional diguanylate cyclase/phosphodiesterase [Burkholderiaceae bacterium]